MTKVQVRNNIYYYEVSIKPNVDIIVIVVSMWRQHKSTSDDVLKIQYDIGKGFGSREIELYMGVQDYFFL